MYWTQGGRRDLFWRTITLWMLAIQCSIEDTWTVPAVPIRTVTEGYETFQTSVQDFKISSDEYH